MSSVIAPDPVQTPLRSPTPSAADAAQARRRPGGVTLVRHGEPELSRRIKLNAAAYRRWWAAYEAGGILPNQSPPPALLELARRADAVFASTRLRAVQTAQAVTGGRAFLQEPLLIEAPLPPPGLPAWLRLNPRAWGLISRAAWWFFDHHAGEESRAEAERRASAAADKLVAAATDGREVLVLAHGFFNAMLARELKRRGWRKVSGGNAFTRYWQARRFEPR